MSGARLVERACAARDRYHVKQKRADLKDIYRNLRTKAKLEFKRVYDATGGFVQGLCLKDFRNMTSCVPKYVLNIPL